MSNKKEEVKKDILTDLFNVDMDRAEEITAVFAETLKTEEELGVGGWSDVVNKTMEKAKVTGVGEGMLLGYLFGRAYQQAKEQCQACDEVKRLAAMLEKAMLENSKGKKTN